MSKTISVLKRKNRYVAGVFTDLGLFSTSLPRESRESAISALKGKQMELINTPERLAVLDIVFRIDEGAEDVSVSEVKVDLSGLTEKQRLVYQALLEIPRGETITYGQLAERAGCPNGARFVGTCMANNRLGPIIPCHRVVASNGLGGYGPGLDKKRDLLQKEGVL
ncbi:MAG: hypothetical protein BAJATHORv1_40025 [Candidatus Thorarchaeota archaeon]|nr:MAG: hypothetical protein BAJATHORv1_40025 [Candidatus Thorarchaeota archaeon]